MYRKRARKDYLCLSKSKKHRAKAVRTAVCKQLQYIRRDVGYVVELIQNGAKLSQKQADRLNVATQSTGSKGSGLSLEPTASPGELSVAW